MQVSVWSLHKLLKKNGEAYFLLLLKKTFKQYTFKRCMLIPNSLWIHHTVASGLGSTNMASGICYSR